MLRTLVVRSMSSRISATVKLKKHVSIAILSKIFAAAGLTTAIRRSNVNQELENTYLTILAVFYLDFKEKKRTIPLPHCKRLFCETGELLAKGIGEAKWEGRVVVGRCVGSGVRLSTGLFQPSQSIVSSRIRLAAKSAPVQCGLTNPADSQSQPQTGIA